MRSIFICVSVIVVLALAMPVSAQLVVELIRRLTP